MLGVEPGSVTPLAIVNDTDRRVTHVLDKVWIGQELVACHPLQNDATTVLAGADLLRFVRSTGHEPADRRPRRGLTARSGSVASLSADRPAVPT